MEFDMKNISEISGKDTLKIAISKAKENVDGVDFEECLYKAMYIYPKPHNPNAQTVDAHAKQIYDSELIERSVCEVWPEYFKPLTFRNVQKFFTGEDYDRLMAGVERTVTKDRKRKTATGDWESYDEIKKVIEYEYMFNDIFWVPNMHNGFETAQLIIECKVYKDESGRRNHIDKIRNMRNRYKSVDYFLLAHDKSDTEFDVTDLISMSQQGHCKYHDFKELVT
jgi:hypothetical protein